MTLPHIEDIFRFVDTLLGDTNPNNEFGTSPLLAFFKCCTRDKGDKPNNVYRNSTRKALPNQF